ncbi:hypothetical protein PLEOSDRAFT_1084969 [Pleurotus ostreatus PC15]|uniref:DJ-1/PfpI domain-containing protein n=1 Tax=Pleurotus ostreatus (strain PC15) TaxID=1137138 RepID=A0A067NMS0_PLEO1|nr:hypothetical protein PLEOSDRAFT_1084969 [Pleurotus ostreatus PC15]
MATGHSPTILRLAVCLFEDVTSLDYQGPIALFGCIEPEFANKYLQDLPLASAGLKYMLEIVYLAESLDLVKSSPGPLVVPSRRYDEIGDSEQFDILLIPGGPVARPENVPRSLLEFVQRQALGACTFQPFARVPGFLQERVSSVDNTRGEEIEWIAKARWVVNEDDGRKIWTSSGVTAGKEAMAFLRGIVELTAKGESEDDFAAYYGLV